MPMAQNSGAGVLERAWPDGMGRLVVNSSARIPERAQPADCVVVGLLQNGRWQARWVLGTHGANGSFSGRFLRRTCLLNAQRFGRGPSIFRTSERSRSPAKSESARRERAFVSGKYCEKRGGLCGQPPPGNSADAGGVASGAALALPLSKRFRVNRRASPD